jgi:hypothetical protein
MGWLLTIFLETISDLVFSGAPHHRGTTWVLGSILLSALLLLAWGLWRLWSQSG